MINIVTRIEKVKDKDGKYRFSRIFFLGRYRQSIVDESLAERFALKLELSLRGFK